MAFLLQLNRLQIDFSCPPKEDFRSCSDHELSMTVKFLQLAKHCKISTLATRTEVLILGVIGAHLSLCLTCLKRLAPCHLYNDWAWFFLHPSPASRSINCFSAAVGPFCCMARSSVHSMSFADTSELLAFYYCRFLPKSRATSCSASPTTAAWMK